MINLNAKERMFLDDEKTHEQLCIQKYNNYSNKASDTELKNLFSQIAKTEQEHLDSINQILNGTVPNVNQAQGQNSQSQMPNLGNTGNSSKPKNIAYNENDKLLCQDMLATEKYISSTYNSAIFEVRDTNIRQVLNHIQKEEQEHGEQIYNYMNQHGMY